MFLEPLTTTFGGVVSDGFSVEDAASADDEIIEKIRSDVHKYRFLLFRKQRDLSGERQVAFSRRLGSIESTFYKHPKSPHPDIFRVSNDEGVGCTRVGRSGWHVDGTFLSRPFRYQTMYFPKASSTGFTELVPLKELFQSQKPERRERWDRAWFVSDSGSVVHPLVCEHPTTGYTTMIFHCGRPFCAGWIMDYIPGQQPRRDDILPPSVIQDEITEAIDEGRSRNLVYTMKWEEGDFGILDNLALAHYAVPGTQDPASRVGLRILHRTTIEGDAEPRKSKGEPGGFQSTSRDAFSTFAPSGLKGKLASLEDFIAMQNEELAAQRQEIEALRNDKANIEQHYQGQLQDLKKTVVADVQRMQDEVKRHFSHQKAENSRLQQQITTLKGEKTSLQQQILGLQRRIQEIEEQIGSD
ncbi:hypothetical protein FOZ60_006436 [Perkinsus olseni]|uniref:TauD/TfdA-like domain-containing protein n=1 Tax=Perkinsus olseni TaxID=32597 RepID=A0A7J6PGP0_PEROL|nr:hypothetical protein FOZ60_006436 [Perkinsus olseni]